MPANYTLTPILGNGQSYFNLLIVSEGFDGGNLGIFETNAKLLRDAMVKEGWYQTATKANPNALAVWMCGIDASGGIPLEFLKSPATSGKAIPRVLFKTKYGAFGQDNGLYGDDEPMVTFIACSLERTAAHQERPLIYDSCVVLVNYDRPGGACGDGQVGWSSIAPGFTKLALHEFGHTVGLADEYEALDGTADGDGADDRWEPNTVGEAATQTWTRFPWRSEIKDHPVPTSGPKGCTAMVYQGDHHWSYVGAFEGADGFHCGCYRPCRTCRMRDPKFSFCGLCRKFIAGKIDDNLGLPKDAPPP